MSGKLFVTWEVGSDWLFLRRTDVKRQLSVSFAECYEQALHVAGDALHRPASPGKPSVELRPGNDEILVGQGSSRTRYRLPLLALWDYAELRDLNENRA
jgi:hypothetical protein